MSFYNSGSLPAGLFVYLQNNERNAEMVSAVNALVYNKTVHFRVLGCHSDVCSDEKTEMGDLFSLEPFLLYVFIYGLKRDHRIEEVLRVHTFVHNVGYYLEIRVKTADTFTV